MKVQHKDLGECEVVYKKGNKLIIKPMKLDPEKFEFREPDDVFEADPKDLSPISRKTDNRPL